MQETYPELKLRVQSAFIDAILVIVLMFATASVLDKFDNVPDSVRIILFIMIVLLYEPFFMTLGCTLGNYFSQVRVRKEANSSKRINFLQAIVRYPIKLILGWISFLTISSNPKRRAIHDMVSGTVVIKV